MKAKNDIKSKKKILSVETMALVALFAALMCVCSWIAVPSPFNPAVPFTLQTLAIILAGLILNPVEALFASIVYFLLGIVGLPVFANFTTFYAKVFTAAGGYFIGFFITPVIISLLRTIIFKAVDKKFSGAKRNSIHFAVYILLSIIVGILAVDIPGVIVGKIITNADFGTSIFMFAISFMPTDIIKCVSAAILAAALEKPLSIIRNRKK